MSGLVPVCFYLQGFLWGLLAPYFLSRRTLVTWTASDLPEDPDF